MAGRSVGSIGIDVHPDTSTFNEKLLSAIKGAEKKHAINIPVRPDVNGNGRTGEPSMATKIRNVRDDIEDKIRAGNVKIRIPVATTNDENEATSEARSKADRISARLRSQGVKVKLPVGFDNDQIATDLRRAIEEAQRKINRELHFKVRIEFDETKLRTQWRNLKEEFQNDTIELKAELDRQAVVQSQLALLARDRVVQLFVRINQRSLATAEATLAAITGANILQRAGRALEGFVQNLDSIAFATARVGSKMSLIGSTALASTSSVVALGGALGQLGGYVIQLPGLLAGLAAAGASLFASFQGFGDLMASPASALNKLGKEIPNAMYNAALAMSGSWTRIAQEAKNNFWPAASGAFEDFARLVVPRVVTGMGEVSKSMGGFVKQALDAVSSAGPNTLSSIFTRIATGIREATFGVQPFTRAMIALTDAGARRLPEMGRWFTEIATTFEHWIARSQTNGNLDKWLDNAATAAHNLGQILIGIKGTLSGLVSAARDSGGGDLQTFADTMNRVRSAVESPIFQDTLRNMFRGAHDAIQSVQDGLKDLGFALYDVAPALRSIMQISGDTIGSTISSIAEALKTKVLQSGAVDFFTGVRDGLKGMLDYLPNVATGLGNVGSVLGLVFQGVGPTVGTLFGGIADTFSELTPVLKELVPILTNFSASAVGGLVDALGILAVPLKAILELFGNLPSFVQTALLALLLLKRFTNGPLGNPFAATNRSLQQVPGHANAARRALAQPLGGGFLDPRAFAPAIQAIASIPGEVYRAYRDTYNRLASADIQPFQRLVNSANDAVRGIQAAFARVFSGVATGASGLGTALGNASFLSPYKNLAQDIGQAIRSGYSALTTAARQGGMLAAEAFSRGFAAARDFARQALQTIASDFRALSFSDFTRAAATAAQGFTSLRVAAERVVTDLRNAGSAIAGGFAAGLQAVRSSLSQIPGDFRFAGALAAQALSNGFAAVRGFFQSHLQTLANEMRGGQGFSDMQRAGQAMANSFASGWGALRGLMSQFIVPAMTSAFDQVRQAATTAGQTISQGWLRGVGTAMLTDLDRMTSGMRTAMSTVVEHAANMVRGVGQHMSGLPGLAGSAFSGLGSLARGTFDGIVNTAVAAGNGLARGITAGANAVGRTFTSLFSFLGGGWGAAFAAGFIALDKIQEQNRKIEASARAVERAYRSVAEAALQAGEGIGDMASQEASMRRLLELRNQFFTERGLFGGETVSIFDKLRESGLGDQEFLNLMTGQGGAAASAYIEGLQNELVVARQSIKNDANPFQGLITFFADKELRPTEDALNGIKTQAADAKAELERIWKTDVGRSQGVAAALDKITESGEGVKVTLGNVNGIRADVFSNLTNDTAKVSQYATAFATAMGGSSEQVQLNFQRIQNSILEYQRFNPGGNDPLNAIVQGMVRANAPVSNIKKALQEFGLTAEQAAEQITFVWGPAADEFGRGLQVNGQLVPKLYEFSSGVQEFSQALGAASNINPDTLVRAISLNGFDPAKFAPSLVQYGVGIDQIRAALQAMGTPSAEVGNVLASIAEAAGKLNAGGVLNPLTVQRFSEALASIRDSADGAADKASALHDALQDLLPGRDAFDLAVQFADARREIEGLNKAVGEDSGGIKKLAEAFDESTGAIDANIKGIGDVKAKLEDFAVAGLGKAIQAYEDEMKASGDSVLARQKMKDSISEMGPVLDGLRASLEEANGEATVTDEAWQNFLRTLGLTPDQIEILAIAQTDGAAGQIAELAALLTSVPPGVTVRADALTDDAAAKLRELGLIVEKGPDGVYTVKTSADPTEAKNQLASLQEYLRTTPITADISVTTETAKAKILEQLSNIPLSVNVQGKIDAALDAIKGLDGTPVSADARAIIDKAIADISQLNGTNVEADAGAIIDRALADIYALNGTPVTADANANTEPAKGHINALNGWDVWADIFGSTSPIVGTFNALGGTDIWTDIFGDPGPVQGAINRLSGQNVYVNVVARGISAIAGAIAGLFKNADGNVFEPGSMRVKHFASGGIENHQAQIAKAGAWRIWAEPETGGEAYIPLAPAKRARSLEILSDVASRFGYTLTRLNAKAQRFAAGGMSVPEGHPVAAASAGGSVVINQYYPQTEKDSTAVLRAGQQLAARGLIF